MSKINIKKLNLFKKDTCVIYFEELYILKENVEILKIYDDYLIRLKDPKQVIFGCIYKPYANTLKDISLIRKEFKFIELTKKQIPEWFNVTLKEVREEYDKLNEERFKKSIEKEEKKEELKKILKAAEKEQIQDKIDIPIEQKNNIFVNFLRKFKNAKNV